MFCAECGKQMVDSPPRRYGVPHSPYDPATGKPTMIKACPDERCRGRCYKLGCEGPGECYHCGGEVCTYL